jgi:hypothetical protein
MFRKHRHTQFILLKIGVERGNAKNSHKIKIIRS